MSDIAREIDLLDVDVVQPAMPHDPYELVLYENAGYLVEDERRGQLFARLISLAPTPVRLLAANHAALLAIARDGGMRPETRVERWREIARTTLDAGGDLRAALVAGSIAERKRLLKSFPSLGDAGVAKVRLFALDETCATIESNGLRVLERLGYASAGASYATKYREAVRLLEHTFATPAALRRAWYVLRHHGKTTCRRNEPDRAACRASQRCNATLGIDG